ncbi:hypothetical protein [Sulfitobacter sp.]|uniref:hypothetical protein n=2 Tax=Sulfitobacter sp. TaxID=1903071 RepID=UPI0039E55C33
MHQFAQEQMAIEVKRMQRFTTAKFILGLIVFVGWVVVAIAVIVFFLPFFEVALWIKILGLVGGSLYGLTTVAVGQMGLAQIATAENTKRMIELLERSQRGINAQSPAVARNGPKIEPMLTKPN